FFFSSRRRHTRCYRDWSSDVCSSDLPYHTKCGEVLFVEVGRGASEHLDSCWREIGVGQYPRSVIGISGQKYAISRLELAAQDRGHSGHSRRENHALGVFQNRELFFERAPCWIAPTCVLIRPGRIARKKKDARENNPR